MIRFSNPGTQYSTQIQVIKQLYAALNDKAYFTLEDMAVVIAQQEHLHLLNMSHFCGFQSLPKK